MSKIQRANWGEIEDGKLDVINAQLTSYPKPTYAQINRIYLWFKWIMPTPKAISASKWLENNATRRQVSVEMDRIKGLKDARNLTEETCFASPIWEGYDERFV